MIQIDESNLYKLDKILTKRNKARDLDIPDLEHVIDRDLAKEGIIAIKTISKINNLWSQSEMISGDSPVDLILDHLQAATFSIALKILSKEEKEETEILVLKRFLSSIKSVELSDD